MKKKKKRERERKNIPTLICTPTDHLGSVYITHANSLYHRCTPIVHLDAVVNIQIYICDITI